MLLGKVHVLCSSGHRTVMLGKPLVPQLQQYAGKLHKWHACTQQAYNEVDYARVYYGLYSHKGNLHAALEDRVDTDGKQQASTCSSRACFCSRKVCQEKGHESRELPK